MDWKPRNSAPGLPLAFDDNPHRKRRRMTSFLNTRVVRVTLIALVAVGLFGVIFYSTSQPRIAEVKKVSPESAAINAGASSTECVRSFDGKRPITQYVIMIDAGSSGSRVHVYEFNNCQAMPRLMHEEFKMIDGGLSSYEGRPSEAAHSLDVLLDVALNTVPKDLHHCTPIAVKATAGLRKLGDVKSKEILDAVTSHITDNYPFALVENGVSIMPGEEEGVFAWVTANYLLEKIGTPAKTPTVAVFDLGGGSTQIVFEPAFNSENKQLMDGDHKYELNFGGRKFVLYQHSYLGYGLNEARNKITDLIVGLEDKERLFSPCLPPEVSVETKVRDKTVTLVGPDEPSPLQCRFFAEKILDKEAVCALPPCSFGGVHQPPLFEAFPRDSDMYVFSFFYDRTSPLGMPQSFTLDELRDLTHKVCAGPKAYNSFMAIDGAVNALKENPQWCLELNYMEALLRTGYDIRGGREVRIAKKINNNELGWCLGASLPLLDGVGWSCKSVAN